MARSSVEFPGPRWAEILIRGVVPFVWIGKQPSDRFNDDTLAARSLTVSIGIAQRQASCRVR
jgi:hypothetical protein